MKIKLFIIVDNLGVGGTQQQIIEYLKHANRNKFLITVINLDKNYDTLSSEIAKLGYKVVGINHKGFFNFATLLRLTWLFIKEKPYVVHTFLFTADSYGRLAAKLANVPVVISAVRNIDLWQKWRHNCADIILAGFTDRITVNANIITSHLINTKRIPSEKITTIYNGVDLKRFENLCLPEEVKKTLSIPKDALVVGMVSRFAEQKDYGIFFDAAQNVLKEIPNVYFVAVGDGPLLKDYKSQIIERKLQDRIIFVGLRKDVPALINAMDICVLSSHCEGCPNVILEYMACSKAVIATNVGGCSELIINNKTGLVVPPRDVTVLAATIVKLLKDNWLRQQMGSNGRRHVERYFTSEIMAKKTEALYKELLQPKIAFIMPQFPRYDETFISRELLELQRNGLNLHIFSLKHSKDKIVHKEVEPLLKRTININFIFSFKLLWAQVYFIITNPFGYLSALLFIFRLVYRSPRYLVRAIAIFPKSVYFAKLSKVLRVAHIHAQWATTPCVSAMIIKRLTGIPFSFSGHAHDIYVDTVGLKEKINEAEFVTTCTADNREYLLRLINSRQDTASQNHQPETKIIINYHGVDLERLNDKARMQTLGNRHFRILSVGSLLSCKGFDILIKACRLLRDEGIDFECTIAGGGHLEDKLKLLANRYMLNAKLKFTGYITQDELIPLYQQADVFALPVRLDIHWGIPNVLLEAMAAGLPVITTRLPSMPELIEDGKNGFIIPEKNARALADTLIMLYKFNNLRWQVGTRGIKTVEDKFNLKKNAKELEKIFNQRVAYGQGPNRAKDKLLVLAYHRISDDFPGRYTAVKVENFKKQMYFLKKHSFNTISLDEAYEFIRSGKKIPAKSALITFDDGYKDNYVNVYPILKQYGFKAAIFLTAAKIGKDSDYLNWDEVNRMFGDGISFGSHTLTHPNLCSLSQESAKKELKESRLLMEQNIGQNIDFFCYPYGYFNNSAKSLVKEAGYKGAFTVLPGYANRGQDPYEIKRIEIGNNDGLLRFRAKLRSLYLPLQRYMYNRNILSKIEASANNGRLNILYIIWSLGLGGAERVVINSVKCLDKSRYNPIVCCLNEKGEFAKELEDMGIEVIPMHKKGKIDLQLISKLVKLMREYNIDIVHTHLWGANFWGRIAAKRAGVKCIIANEHGIEAWRTPLHFVLDRVLAPFTDRVIFVSESARNLYIGKTGINKDKCAIVYNGIDLKRFDNNLDNNKVRRELGISSDEFVIAIIGRLVEGKGHQYLFEALERLNGHKPYIRCLVVGEGPLRKHLESMADGRTASAIHFLGLRRDIPEILAATDLVVLPSIKEAMPISILEAMAQGKAIVATRIGGLPELVQDGSTGLLVESESVEELSSAIGELITNREKLKILGINSRKRIEEKFNIEETAKAIQKLYQECLEDK